MLSAQPGKLDEPRRLNMTGAALVLCRLIDKASGKTIWVETNTHSCTAALGDSLMEA